MQRFKFFLSVIWVVRNSNDTLFDHLSSFGQYLSSIVDDYEIVVVDNGSSDNSIETLRILLRERGLPNIQVFALTKEVNLETAQWVGLENALGDYAVVIDLDGDDFNLISQMLNKAALGKDVIFATNISPIKYSTSYQIMLRIFNIVSKRLTGLDVIKDIPTFRLVSKKVINYLLQFSNPADQYRYLPATAGFAKETINYKSGKVRSHQKSIAASIEKGIALLISTTKAPMRIVTTFSLFGAVSNLIYSVYVLFIAFFKTNVAPGWVTLSLQQSGMFFLFSIVLFILGEYILHMANISNEGPKFHIAQEITSSKIDYRDKLNITEKKHV